LEHAWLKATKATKNRDLRPITPPEGTRNTLTKGEIMRGTKYAPEFKLKLVQQVLSGEKRPAQLCREHNISEAILLKWRHTFAEKGETAFKPVSNELETLSRERQLEKRVAELERMIGQLAFENSILKTVLAHKTAPS
jgi:transposase